MIKKTLSLPLIALLLMATGCASIVDGKSQAVVFNTTPDGAEVIYNNTKLGVTPFTSILQRSEADKMVVVVRKEGYEDQNVQLTTRINYWFWGNILAGGLIGSTTDFVSGAYVEYEPNKYFINLVPKKASELEREQIKRAMWTRNFILVGYRHLERELAAGPGEYLSSLCSMFGIEEGKKEESYQQLRQLMVQHQHDAPAFAQSVLEQFHWE